MEKYRETTERHKVRLYWLILAVIALLGWLYMEINTIISGKISVLGLGYIVFFTGIITWRFAFRYTCVLTDDSFIVITQGLGIKRTLIVKLTDLESFSNRYVKNFFRQTGISRYIYRYSSFDNRPVRIFVFQERGKLQAVLFKSSGQFIEELKKTAPHNFLDLGNENDRR